MRKYYYLLLAALTLSAFAGNASEKSREASATQEWQKETGNVVAASPIMDPPAGERFTYKRNGKAYILQGQIAVMGDYDFVYGEIIKGDDGYVYIKDLVSQFPTGAYVRGEEKDGVITVNFPQSIRGRRSQSRLL